MQREIVTKINADSYYSCISKPSYLTEDMIKTVYSLISLSDLLNGPRKIAFGRINYNKGVLNCNKSSQVRINISELILCFVVNEERKPG